MNVNNYDKYRLSSANPFPPPNRRYLLAKKCVSFGHRPSRRDDKCTWELFRYLTRRQVFSESSQKMELRKAYPGIAVAVDLHHGRAQELRPIVEAYLLTDLDDSAIATRLGVVTQSIRWYRLAFFDIRHLRAAPLRIMRQVIGIVDRTGHYVLDQNSIAKWVGFVLGPEALDQLLGVDPQSTLVRTDGLHAWFSQLTQAALILKQLIAASSLNLNDPKQIEILLKHRSTSNRSERPAEAASLNGMEVCIKAMLDDIPFAFGEDGEKLNEGTLIGEWDKSAVDLSADELLKMGAGQDVPGLDEWRNITLPPPRRQKPTLAAGQDGSLLKPDA